MNVKKAVSGGGPDRIGTECLHNSCAPTFCRHFCDISATSGRQSHQMVLLF